MNSLFVVIRLSFWWERSPLDNKRCLGVKRNYFNCLSCKSFNALIETYLMHGFRCNFLDWRFIQVLYFFHLTFPNQVNMRSLFCNGHTDLNLRPDPVILPQCCFRNWTLIRMRLKTCLCRASWTGKLTAVLLFCNNVGYCENNASRMLLLWRSLYEKDRLCKKCFYVHCMNIVHCVEQLYPTY